MLLSDKLKEIADKVDITSENSIRDCIQEIVKSCFGHIEEQIKQPNATDQTMIAAFQRVNLLWKQTAQYARSNNKDFIRDEGFSILVKSKDEFKSIHHIF